MIRFACPRCKAVLERPDEVGGTTFACPGCGQRLQAPPARQPSQPIASTAPPPGQVEVRKVDGREHVFWNCPLCQGHVDIALDLGQAAVRCQHCSQKIAVPTPSAPATAPAPPPPVLPPPLPSSFLKASSNPEPPSSRKAEPPIPMMPPEPPPPRIKRRDRDRDYDDDYDDDDYPSIARRGPRGRYSREAAAKAASSGLVCSLVSLALLLLSFVLWVVAMSNHRRMGEGEPMIVVILLVVLGSFVLSIMGIVFSSRGLDESNDYNRGQATAGLVCGIISVAIGSIVGLFFLCVGMVMLSMPGGRF